MPDLVMTTAFKNIDKTINITFNISMRILITYIDDIVEGVVRISDVVPVGNPDWDEENPDPATSVAPYRVYNIGNSQPTRLMDYITCIEKASMNRNGDISGLPHGP